MPAAEQKAHLDVLLEAANELLEDSQRVVPSAEPVDPGFVSSFQDYPAAQAHAYVPFPWNTITHLDMSAIPSALGYYFVQMGRSGDNPMEKKAHHLLAVGEYIKAANMLPEDDEKHCCTSTFSRRRADVQLNV